VARAASHSSAARHPEHETETRDFKYSANNIVNAHDHEPRPSSLDERLEMTHD
jgi:hypothetical protein